MHSLITLLIITGLLWGLVFPAYANTQREHKQVQDRIDTLEKKIKKDKTVARSISNEVEGLEKKLATITDKQYQTERSIKKLTEELSNNEAEVAELKDKLGKQKSALAQQLQALHTAGSQSHLRLLLKQDDPSDISRTVKYFEYLNRGRVKKIKEIKGLLKKVETIETKLVKDRQALGELKLQLAKEQSDVKSVVEQRRVALKRAKRAVSSKSAKLKKLKRQEKRLQNQLDKLIRRQAQKERERERAQQIAANRAAEKKRAARPAQRQPEKKPVNRQEIKQPKSVKPAKPSVAASKPVQSKAQGKVVGSSQRFVPNKPFYKLRKKLNWPVKGRISARYGSRRNEKQRWKGVLIDARGGTRVRAIAKGVVEYAGWFKGYGFLIIIRHDKRYRSLYGYNRAVHVREGNVVNAGTVIASVGSSGGQKKNALYFEIRKNKIPQNPAGWCR